MELIEKPNQSSKSSTYSWVEDDYRFILHLGKMKNAVVIHSSYKYKDYFRIGVASFFPFTDEMYNKKYDSLEQAKQVASDYIMSWLNETNLALKNY
jgi:hypothetical protein